MLLLIALLVPSGLHAKQLVDFCMTKTTHSAMAADHSCCETTAEPDHHQNEDASHHDCDWGFICACNIGENLLSDNDWITSNNDVTVTLAETENLTTFITSAEPIHREQQHRIGQYNPPLWLLYDTFLI